METLDIRITSMYPSGKEGGIRAYVSATINGCLGIRGIKIVEGGRDGLFVSMPSRKTLDGYREICFPVTSEFRQEFHEAVLNVYHQELAQMQEEVQQQDAPSAEQETSQEETQSGPQMSEM